MHGVQRRTEPVGSRYQQPAGNNATVHSEKTRRERHTRSLRTFQRDRLTPSKSDSSVGHCSGRPGRFNPADNNRTCHPDPHSDVSFSCTQEIVRYPPRLSVMSLSAWHFRGQVWSSPSRRQYLFCAVRGDDVRGGTGSGGSGCDCPHPARVHRTTRTHLPVGFDTWFAEDLLLEAGQLAEEAGVLSVVLPALPFGPTPEHSGFGAGSSIFQSQYTKRWFGRSLAHCRGRGSGEC
jgi:hypothetical protein